MNLVSFIISVIVLLALIIGTIYLFASINSSALKELARQNGWKPSEVKTNYIKQLENGGHSLEELERMMLIHQDEIKRMGGLSTLAGKSDKLLSRWTKDFYDKKAGLLKRVNRVNIESAAVMHKKIDKIGEELLYCLQEEKEEQLGESLALREKKISEFLQNESINDEHFVRLKQLALFSETIPDRQFIENMKPSYHLVIPEIQMLGATDYIILLLQGIERLFEDKSSSIKQSIKPKAKEDYENLFISLTILDKTYDRINKRTADLGLYVKGELQQMTISKLEHDFRKLQDDLKLDKNVRDLVNEVVNRRRSIMAFLDEERPFDPFET